MLTFSFCLLHPRVASAGALECLFVQTSGEGVPTPAEGSCLWWAGCHCSSSNDVKTQTAAVISVITELPAEA